MYDILKKIIILALCAYEEKRPVIPLLPAKSNTPTEDSNGEEQRPIGRKDLLSFVSSIADSVGDLEHLYVRVLVQLGKESRAIKVLHSMTDSHTPVSESDANHLLVYVGETKSCPQPETSIAFFGHICSIAPSIVSGKLHGNFMRCLLSAGRVDLALKHYAKLEEDESNAGTMLPAEVYNALLSSFRASEDQTGLKKTWGCKGRHAGLPFIRNHDVLSYRGGATPSERRPYLMRLWRVNVHVSVN